MAGCISFTICCVGILPWLSASMALAIFGAGAVLPVAALNACEPCASCLGSTAGVAVGCPYGETELAPYSLTCFLSFCLLILHDVQLEWE